jgi:hypothetical protein
MSQAGAVTMKAMVQRLNRRLERDSKVLTPKRHLPDRARHLTLGPQIRVRVMSANQTSAIEPPVQI